MKKWTETGYEVKFVLYNLLCFSGILVVLYYKKIFIGEAYPILKQVGIIKKRAKKRPFRGLKEKVLWIYQIYP